MKTKDKHHLKVNPGIFLLVPVIFLATIAICSCASKKRIPVAKTEIAPSLSDETPYVVVEEMPLFPGGDSALLAYIASNTKYPELAKTNSIQGRVIARFCVNKEGGVDRISILRGVDPELDNEAIRVVSSLPTFIPGKQGGKSVNVWYMVPITFALGESKNATEIAPGKQK